METFCRVLIIVWLTAGCVGRSITAWNGEPPLKLPRQKGGYAVAAGVILTLLIAAVLYGAGTFGD